VVPRSRAIGGRMRCPRALTCWPGRRPVPFGCLPTWTGPSRRVRPRRPGRIVDLYRAVLIEAASPQDLYEYLDAGMLRRLWALLWLPAQLRRTWEQRFPVLAEISRVTAAA
jgi:hypothetical protein